MATCDREGKKTVAKDERLLFRSELFILLEIFDCKFNLMMKKVTVEEVIVTDQMK